MRQQEKLITKAFIIIGDEECASQRIDNFLFNRLKNIPKSHIYKMLRSGSVRVNKKRIAPSYKIQPNDAIRIPPFWSENIVSTGRKNRPSANLVKLLLAAIIFEDKKILVVNKPTGIAAHGGSGINFGVIEALRFARNDLKNLELAHRLDRDTSGCLVLAKKRSALREFHQLAYRSEISKKYILLVKGKWQGGERVVDVPLLKNQLKSGERVVKVEQSGKRSITIFRPLRVGADASLLEAELKTGRTHQIRVHAAHIGHPIAGDEKYGDDGFNRKIKTLGLKRLFLHAKKINFCWADSETVHVVAKLDDALRDLLVKIF